MALVFVGKFVNEAFCLDLIGSSKCLVILDEDDDYIITEDEEEEDEEEEDDDDGKHFKFFKFIFKFNFLF